MFNSRRLLAVIVVAAGAVAASAGMASASVHPVFVRHAAAFNGTAVAQIVRPDSGNGGDWATDQINRTTVVTQTGPNTYSATISDEGSFATIPFAPTPNQGGVNMGDFITANGNGMGATATLTGGRTYSIVSAVGPDMSAISGHISGAPSSAGWMDLAFPYGTVTANNDWSWTYRLTCHGFNGFHPPTQVWVDAASNGAGNLPADGNIFGC